MIAHQVVGLMGAIAVCSVDPAPIKAEQPPSPTPVGSENDLDADLAPMPAAASEIDVDADLTPRVAGSIRARATVEIDAPIEVVRDEVLDLDARVKEGWLVDSVSIYRDEATATTIHRRAKWTLSIFGIEIIYHTMYDWDASTSSIHWSLDESRDNDLVHAQGVYKLSAGQSKGTTTLTYTVEVGSKHNAGRALKRRITTRNVAKLLESVRTRSQERS